MSLGWMSRCRLSDHPDGGAEVGAAEDERRQTGSIFPATGMLFFPTSNCVYVLDYQLQHLRGNYEDYYQ